MSNPTITGVSPDSGPLTGSTPVTITGTGLSGSTVAVNFGAAGAADIHVISDTEIHVISPNTASPGSVNITVIVNGISSGVSNADLFNYCAPVITGVSPNRGSIEGGNTVTISGSYLSGTQAVNFGDAGATIISVSPSEVVVINPNMPNAETVDVTIISQGVTSAKSQADQFTYFMAPPSPVPMLFSALDLSNTYIQFIGDKVEGSYYDNSGDLKSLEANTAYSLQSLASGKSLIPDLPNGVPAVLVKSFSGRVYVSLGSGLSSMSPSYTPSAGNSNDPNYSLRYQYFEPTIKNGQLNVDLSYIDFTAISLTLNAMNAPHGTNINQPSQSSRQLADATAAAAISNNGSVLPSPADQLPSSSFARVISPQLAPSSMYHDFSHYLKTTIGTSSVHIKGVYVGTGSQPSGSPSTQAQSYDFTGTFDGNGKITLTPNAGSGNGFAPGVPLVQRGNGISTTADAQSSIVIEFDDLNASTGVYGCNVPYTVGSNPKTSGITNDFWGQVVGDLLAGLNFGYVGSSIQFNKKSIGDLCSTEWWGGSMPYSEPVHTRNTPGGNGIYFEGAQGNPLDYNSYAGSISKLTTGYGFPLQDRLGNNLLTMNTNVDSSAYLMVWVDITPAG